jgi:hypothetical protein
VVEIDSLDASQSDTAITQGQIREARVMSRMTSTAYVVFPFFVIMIGRTMETIDRMVIFRAFVVFPLFVIIIGQTAVLTARRWTVVADYAGRQPQDTLLDQRLGVVLSLALIIGWATIAITFIRHAIQPGIAAPLMPRLVFPPWLAFVLQEHLIGLFCAQYATIHWLHQMLNKRWSQLSRRDRGAWKLGATMFALYPLANSFIPVQDI